jgi:hypothetical protein
MSNSPDPEWYAASRARGQTAVGRAAELIMQVIAEGRSVIESAALMRPKRAQLDEKFCLLLYGSGMDDDLLAQLRTAHSDLATDDEVGAMTAAANDPDRNSRVMLALMWLLDQELDLPLIMLERPSDEPEVGPVRIRAPDELWFPSFCLLAELAQAIIVIGNLGPNLVRETRYLDDAGLRGRVLIYADGMLYAFERGLDLDAQRSWSLAQGGVRDAVLHAAASAAADFAFREAEY